MQNQINTAVIKITDSEFIKTVIYNYSEKKLTIRFAKSNSVWVYSDVPNDVFDKFISLPSTGAAFNVLIRNKFVGEKIKTKTLKYKYD